MVTARSTPQSRIEAARIAPRDVGEPGVEGAAFADVVEQLRRHRCRHRPPRRRRRIRARVGCRRDGFTRFSARIYNAHLHGQRTQAAVGRGRIVEAAGRLSRRAHSCSARASRARRCTSSRRVRSRSSSATVPRRSGWRCSRPATSSARCRCSRAARAAPRRASSPTPSVLAIDASTFDQMLREYPEVAVRMLRALCQRLRRYEDEAVAANRVAQDVLAGAPRHAMGTIEPISPAQLAPPRRGARARPGSPRRAAPGARRARHRVPAARDREVGVGRLDPVTELSPEIDLTALDPQRSLSRRHARVVCRDGRFYLREEIGTANGTFVEGERLATGVERLLEPGARVRFGRVDFVFRSAEPPWPSRSRPRTRARCWWWRSSGQLDTRSAPQLEKALDAPVSSGPQRDPGRLRAARLRDQRRPARAADDRQAGGRGRRPARALRPQPERARGLRHLRLRQPLPDPAGAREPALEWLATNVKAAKVSHLADDLLARRESGTQGGPPRLRRRRHRALGARRPPARRQGQAPASAERAAQASRPRQISVRSSSSGRSPMKSRTARSMAASAPPARLRSAPPRSPAPSRSARRAASAASVRPSVKSASWSPGPSWTA